VRRLIILDAVDPPVDELELSVEGSEHRAFAAVGNAGRFQISIDVNLGIMMGRHLVVFPAFLVKPEPAAFALLGIILNIHADGGADAGEAVEHDGDERAIAQVG